jgi:hypothetical protein
MHVLIVYELFVQKYKSNDYKNDYEWFLIIFKSQQQREFKIMAQMAF